MAIELALTPDSLAAVPTEEFCAAAGNAGFDAIGLAAAGATPDVRPVLERAGVRCHDVLALVISDDRDRSVGGAERIATAANVVGAPWVLSVYLSPIGPALFDAVNECASIVKEAGARLAVEFSPLGPVATIPDALAIVDAAGADRAGVVIDSWHVLHGPDPWDDVANVPLDRIAYVQFTDGFDAASMDETMSNRVLPGEGTLPLDRFATTLLDRGWEGVVSVEVLNRELRRLPVSEFADRAFRATDAYWR